MLSEPYIQDTDCNNFFIESETGDAINSVMFKRFSLFTSEQENQLAAN